MYETRYYTIHKSCPCDIGQETARKALDIYKSSRDISTFVSEMEKQRIIGKRIWYDETENSIFITKMYACDCGGGCSENKCLIGERCHCSHYNHTNEIKPKYYCKCGAEFYRPMFAPIFGDAVLIEPYKTILSGDDECVLAIRIGESEPK